LEAWHARVPCIPEAERLHRAAHHQRAGPRISEPAILNPCRRINRPLAALIMRHGLTLRCDRTWRRLLGNGATLIVYRAASKLPCVGAPSLPLDAIARIVGPWSAFSSGLCSV